MFGFPPILDGNAGAKMTRGADSGFPKPGIREIFYSVRDGDWTNPNTWQTASGRVGILPGPNDDVYVRHTVGGSFNAIVNNLTITLTGVLNGNQFNNLPLVVLNSLQSYGTFNYAPNSNGGGNNLIVLCGINNYIDKTKQTPTCIHYGGTTAQPIIDANYTVLRWGNWINAATRLALGLPEAAGEKYLTCDLTVGSIDVTNTGTTLPVYINFKNFNFTCNGNIGAAGTHAGNFYCDGNGTLIFKGASSFAGGFYCSNSPTIEFQGNVEIGFGGNIARWNTPYTLGNSYLGTGTVRFTTNNQTFLIGFATLTFDNTFEIADNITVNLNVTNNGSGLNITKTINGLGANSTLRMGTNAFLNFATAASVPSMTTGTWDFTTNANTIQYNGNYSATIPSYFTTFHNLTIGGTGTKTVSTNTTINNNLVCLVDSTLELSTFNLTVNGTTTIGGSSIASGLLSKNGAGNVLFIGLVRSEVNGVGQRGIDFSGNPNVEFRNGFQFYTLVGINAGTGTWTFSTNSQTINFLGINSTTFNCTLLISGAINLTLVGGGSNGGCTITNINGTDVNSRLINNSILTIPNSTGIMSTGQVDFASNVNTVSYTVSGNYTIPNYSYYSLRILGGGTKTLSGNTILPGDLTVGQATTLECSSYGLTVNGNTRLGASGGPSGTLSKNNATGGILFVGSLYMDSGPDVTSKGLDFSGNPNVEFRGGIITFYNVANIVNTGTGTWSFTTNNQTFVVSNALTLACNISIANNIILTLSHTSTVIYTDVINGSNAASTLRLAANTIANYRNATQPMATGILDTSTNLNTFIYGAGNQDVKGGTPQQYRNLRFSGSGTTKTLQGNINVQNTYTVDSGVVVNLNGFTKTP